MAPGVAAALTATREDEAGLAVRQVGDAGVKLVCHARRLDREHLISHSLFSAGHTLFTGTTGQAKQVLGQVREQQRSVGNLGRKLSAAGLALARAGFAATAAAA